MKKTILALVMAAGGCLAGHAEDLYWPTYGPWTAYDRPVAFDLTSPGVSLPILWGFDTAWNDYGNMLRGVRHSGQDAVGVVRVSFQPWAKIETKGVLPEMLQRNLDARMATVALIDHPVQIALNLDGGEPTIKSLYGGLDEDGKYVGDPESAARQYALLIDATAAAVQAKGYTVVSAAPFNEPDYPWNGTPIKVFGLINRQLKNYDEFPRFRDIRLSGGNTLNCDSAWYWYSTLKDYLDEGNTHQLAGDFDHYADFFARVRAEGKYATADELHNVMEAMVGVEYGMQTGIWWGSATSTRGEFMKASSGHRLGYAENRDAWSAASVYRHPDGRVQGFIGCSERQARPSAFNFVSSNCDFWVNGAGPLREYVAALPGDPQGAYMTELQRNAESVFAIETGTDIRPPVNGSYSIFNKGSFKVVSARNGVTTNGNDVVQRSYAGAADQQWNVTPVPYNIGGDFNYWYIRNTADGQSLDDNNWNMAVGGKVITYGPSNNGVQLWTLEYAGEGWYRVRNMQSGLYLDVADNADNTMVLQQEYAERDTQLWRFVASGVEPAINAVPVPSAPRAAVAGIAVGLSWTPSAAYSYSLLRADGDSDYALIARGLTAGRYYDYNVTDGHSYSYCLMAEDAAGNRSEMSAAAGCDYSYSGLLAHFPLSDSLDEAGNNGLGLRTATAPSYASGHDGGRSLNIRNDQCVQLPYSILASDDYTLSFWAMTSSATSNRVLMRTGMGTADNSLTLSTTTGNGLKLTGPQGETIANDNGTAGQWNHIAVVCANGHATLYVNGQGSVQSLSDLPADRVLTYLGYGYNGTADKMMGRLADIKAYNRALTDSEVIADMKGDASVAAVTVEAAVVATEYYSIDGRRISIPVTNGITIVRETLSDGTTRARKLTR